MIKYFLIGLVIIFIIIISIINVKKSKKRKIFKDKFNANREKELKNERALIAKTQEESDKRKAIEDNIRNKTVIIPKKVNHQQFDNILVQNKIKQLYHFTDKQNIESIINTGGLYSWYYCEKNNINIAKPGGSLFSRNLDSRKALQNYVRLSFVKDHPMMYVAKNDNRIINPVILRISKDVILWNGTKYSNINAATEREHISLGNTLNHLNNIKFDIFNLNYFDLDYHGKMQYQAEILVYEKIPINYILNIYDYV